MAKVSKQRKEALAKFDKSKSYSLSEAVNIVKQITYTKFDASVDLNIRLGVDPRKANQMVRGSVTLPHGTGKVVRVLVLCNPDKAQEAIDNMKKNIIRMKRATIISIVAILERVKCMHSAARSTPPVRAVPDLCESFHAKIYMRGTISVPKRATMILQPKGFMPNAAIPSDISVLPNGGCVVSYIRRL